MIRVIAIRNPNQVDVHSIVLSWLNGRPGEAKGERVLVLTFNNRAYLGILGKDGFICRYHVENGKRVQSSLDNKGSRNEEQFAHDCASAIGDLVRVGAISTMLAPRGYEGAALFRRA
jgi:hypothetical protein